MTSLKAVCAFWSCCAVGPAVEPTCVAVVKIAIWLPSTVELRARRDARHGDLRVTHAGHDRAAAVDRGGRYELRRVRRLVLLVGLRQERLQPRRARRCLRRAAREVGGVRARAGRPVGGDRRRRRGALGRRPARAAERVRAAVHERRGADDGAGVEGGVVAVTADDDDDADSGNGEEHAGRLTSGRASDARRRTALMGGGLLGETPQQSRCPHDSRVFPRSRAGRRLQNATRDAVCNPAPGATKALTPAQRALLSSKRIAATP